MTTKTNGSLDNNFKLKLLPTVPQSVNAMWNSKFCLFHDG